MQLKKVDHIGIALSDNEPLKNVLTDVLGMKISLEEPYLDESNICFLPVGDTDVELFSSINSNGSVAQIIAEKGELIDHIAFEVDDIDAAVEELKSKQIPLMQEEPIPGARGSRIVFLDSKATRGIKIELVERPS